VELGGLDRHRACSLRQRVFYRITALPVTPHTSTSACTPVEININPFNSPNPINLKKAVTPSFDMIEH
jgi:hypothetical protein